MRKLLLAVVALGGLAGLTATGAVAQPYEGRPRAEHERRMTTQAEYYHNHHRYHHRHFEHGRWRYWD
jgi:hypothetical protein